MAELNELRVLVACECSQTVCAEFRKLGVECYSCDIQQEYGGHPEWHIQRNVLDLLNGDCAFMTNDGNPHYVFKWDLIIAHPPCTYLCRAQNHLYDVQRFGADYVNNRIRQRERAVDFFMQFTRTGVPTMIENPIGYMGTHYRKSDQCIEPYQFGDACTKATCLWLFDLPKLTPTNIVQPICKHKFPNSNSMGLWYYETSKLKPKDRSRARSKTFPGIAKAIATQYTRYLIYFT